MLAERMIYELKKFNPKAKVRMHGLEGYGLVSVTAVHQHGDVFDPSTSKTVIVLEDAGKQILDDNILSVEELILRLEAHIHNGAISSVEVKMHEMNGKNALFVIAYVNNDGIVVIEDGEDNDLGSELDARYEYAEENNIEPIKFYRDLIELGFTLDDIKNNYPEKFEEAETYYLKLA